MIRGLHISDRHVKRDMRENALNMELQEVLDTRFRDHFIFDSGDITDNGDEAEFERVQGMMAYFRGRWFFCPGNHDYGQGGIFYDPIRAGRFDEMLSIPFAQGGTFAGVNMPVINPIQDGKDKALIISLDSNRETVSPWDFACGEIGKYQRKHLNKILDEAPGEAVKIVLLHHHPWYHPWSGQPIPSAMMRLRDAGPFLKCIKEKIDVLLFGHRHYEGQWIDRKGIPLTLAAPKTPDAGWFSEIIIEGGKVTVNRVQWRKAA